MVRSVYRFREPRRFRVLSSEKAFRELCKRCREVAVADLVQRLEECPSRPRSLCCSRDLRLGVDSPNRRRKTVPSSEWSKRRNCGRHYFTMRRLEIKIEVFDAGRMEGMMARHRGLRLVWLAGRAGLTSDEAHRREVNQWQVRCAFQKVG